MTINVKVLGVHWKSDLDSKWTIILKRANIPRDCQYHWEWWLDSPISIYFFDSSYLILIRFSQSRNGIQKVFFGLTWLWKLVVRLLVEENVTGSAAERSFTGTYSEKYPLDSNSHSYLREGSRFCEPPAAQTLLPSPGRSSSLHSGVWRSHCKSNALRF